MKVKEEIKPTSESRQIERQEPRTLRELDVEVARLLEPELPEFDPNCNPLMLEPPDLSPNRGWLHVHVFDHGDVCEWEPRPFSRSIKAAMDVVEKARKSGWNISMMGEPNDDWWVVFAKDDDELMGQSFRPSLPEAICLAALSAIAAEVNTR